MVKLDVRAYLRTQIMESDEYLDMYKFGEEE
jgi:hypothetical protein